jgi:NADPH:quinone reductase-like Zn-dependent oxidoreductase
MVGMRMVPCEYRGIIGYGSRVFVLTFARMKAWVLERHGPPDRAFALREVPDPAPTKGQVLIRSEGFGLNYADVMARKGLYREAPPPPCVIGYENVGRVERIGENVPADLLGKRVAAITRFGGYASMVATDHRALAVVPDDLGTGEACALTTQGVTAWYMAMIAYPLRSGQRVLIHSAAGGVGHLLVQLAVHQGCEVFAVASGGSKMDLLRSFGAHHAIDRSQLDYAAEVRSLLRGQRLDVSFNAVAGSTFKKDMTLLGDCGTLVMYGGAERGDGFLGALRFVWRMGLVVPIFLMMRSRSLIGVNMLRVGEHRPDVLAECLHGTVHANSEGWLRPTTHELFPADRLMEAHLLLESGRSMGKVALKW